VAPAPLLLLQLVLLLLLLVVVVGCLWVDQWIWALGALVLLLMCGAC
jgi:hypothetical protein